MHPFFFVLVCNTDQESEPDREGGLYPSSPLARQAQMPSELCGGGGF